MAAAPKEGIGAQLTGASGRVLAGGLPLPLFLAAAFATQAGRSHSQVVAAKCVATCQGVDDRASIVQWVALAAVVAATVGVGIVWWRASAHAGLRRTVALVALVAFGVAAALTPFFGAIAPLALIALGAACVAYSALSGPDGDDTRSLDCVMKLHGVRVAVMTIAIYAAFLLVIPQSSPQALDAMLAWSLHPSFVFAGVGSAVLLALVVHDSALLLLGPGVRDGTSPPPDEPPPGGGGARERRKKFVVIWACIAFFALLVPLLSHSYITWYGFAFPFVLAVALLIVSFVPSGSPAPHGLPQAGTAPGFDDARMPAWLRMIAELPLVLFAAGVCLALVQAFVGADWRSSWILAAAEAAILVCLVLLELAARDDAEDITAAPPSIVRHGLVQTQWWASLFAVVAVSDKYLPGIAGIGLVVACALLVTHLFRRTSWVAPVDRDLRWRILGALGLVPLIALLALQLAGQTKLGVIAGAAVIGFTAVWWFLSGGGPSPELRAWLAASGGRGLGLPIARGAGIALVVGALVDIDGTSSIVGTIGAVNFAAAGIVAILHSLVVRFERWFAPPTMFTRMFGLVGRRIPVLTILAAWAVVAVTFLPATAHRLPIVATASQETFTIDDALTEFFERPAPKTSSESRPIVLLASDGGGARGSFWTALVLDCGIAARAPEKAQTGTPCKDGRSSTLTDRARTILLASGVSGGGVGLAQYVSVLNAEDGKRLPEDWAEDVAGYDMLRAPTTWAVAHDLAAALLGLNAPDEHCLRVIPDASDKRTGWANTENGVWCRLVRRVTQDRGSILADSVAGVGSLQRVGPMSLRAARPTRSNALPSYIDNATLAGGIARVLASSLDLAPRLSNGDVHTCSAAGSTPQECDPRPVARARDLVDVLGPHRDMPLMAAATLGARFPIITAPGYVANCNDEGVYKRVAKEKLECEASSSMSDGGFLENSGLLTIRDLLPHIQQRVITENAKGGARYAIYVVEIDNHTRGDLETGDVEAAKSATTLRNLTSARDYIEAYAREATIKAAGSLCYVRVHPTVNAAGSAPTGWLLSDDNERGLAESLRSGKSGDDAASAYPAMKKLDQILDGIYVPKAADGTRKPDACVPQ